MITNNNFLIQIKFIHYCITSNVIDLVLNFQYIFNDLITIKYIYLMDKF